MTTPIVDPPTFTMSVTETLGLPFDPTDLLATGQTPVAATASVTNLKSSVTTTPHASPVISGTGTSTDPYRITQPIDGATDLSGPGTYLLIVNFNASPSINVWAMELRLVATA